MGQFEEVDLLVFHESLSGVGGHDEGLQCLRQDQKLFMRPTLHLHGHVQ